MTKLFSLLALTIATSTFAQTKNNDISMYPKSTEGLEQKVIQLQTLENENDYEVELFVGTKKKVDTCNHFFLAGNFEDKTVEGWGYNYFKFSTDGNIGGTMKLCADNKTIEKTVYAQSTKTRYNSKLPIVVYVPDGYTLEYRIWKADKELTLVK